MIAVAAACALLGIVTLLVGAVQRAKSARLRATPFVPTGEAKARGRARAGETTRLAVEGRVETPVRLTSPLSDERCLYFRVEIHALWKEGEAEKSELLASAHHGPKFSVDDGSGQVLVFPYQGVDGTRQSTRALSEEECRQLLGKLADQSIFGGGVAAASRRLPAGATFTAQEELFPLVDRVFAAGPWDAKHEAITAYEDERIVLSSRGREAVMGRAGALATLFLLVGGVAMAAGAALAVASRLRY
jgi:hypothetical protein